MKTIFKIAFVLLICMFLTTGCLKQGPNRLDDEYANAPSWVTDPSMEGGLSAVGIAPIGPAGLGFAADEATSDGRNRITRMIEVKVRNLNKNFTQQIGIGDDAVVDKVSSQVSRQVASQTLRGSKGTKRWISPKRNLHVLVILDPEIAKDSVKDSIRTSYRNENALWQKFQEQNAQKELDMEIDKEFSRN